MQARGIYLTWLASFVLMELGIIDAVCNQGLIASRIGKCHSIASRPAYLNAICGTLTGRRGSDQPDVTDANGPGYANEQSLVQKRLAGWARQRCRTQASRSARTVSAYSFQTEP